MTETTETLSLEDAAGLRPGVGFTACAACPKDPNGCCSRHQPAFTLWDLCLLYRDDPSFVEALTQRWRTGLYNGGPAVLVESQNSPQCPLLTEGRGCSLPREQRPSHCNLFVCHGPRAGKAALPLVYLAGEMRDYTRAFGQKMGARWALETGDLRPGQPWTPERLLSLIAWAAPRLESYLEANPLPKITGTPEVKVDRKQWFHGNLRL